MASDPMALRRGGKKLPMEDVCYYQWPLPGLDQVLDLLITLLQCRSLQLLYFSLSKGS